jgi:sterol desaturase/sphingolipid hydroxylase (fatty acid hydroxylase superfamily)
VNTPAAREFRLGEGAISGVLSAALGWMGAGAVLCLHFPELLTTPEARAVYPMDLIRAVIQSVLLSAFGLGVLSLLLSARGRRRHGMIGLVTSTLATLAGGAQVTVDGPVGASSYVGLDWFLLNLFVLALVFVPMERLFARIREQPVFRQGFRTDLVYFAVSHLLVQVSVLLTMAPATLLFRWARDSQLQAAVASQPVVLQFFEAMLVADLCGYFCHRAFHQLPFLWRFHQIHHSSRALDWLAGSRLHIADILITRAAGFAALYAVGFSEAATYAYLTFVSFHAVFIHANVRFAFGRLRWLIVTPQFHHWHHSAEHEAIDKNFAVHLPVIDRLMGTLHLPGSRWPERYGIAGDPVPEGFAMQLVYPLRRRRAHSDPP